MYLKLASAALVCALCAPFFYFYLPQLFPPPKTENLFTSENLKLYNGVDKPLLYLSILGKVFDVTKGSTHYSPGAPYNFFIGRDSSRSFITGKFDPKEEDDRVSDLKPDELRSLHNWVKFYGKEYKKVGKLIGRYYNSEGKLTRYGREVKKLIKRALESKEDEDLEKLKFPPCNEEWDYERGTRVWCTTRSGGIQRDWEGYPRQLYEPDFNDYRCACLQTPDLTSNLKPYEDCPPTSTSCFVK